MRLVWPCIFLDGRTAARHPASLHLQHDGIEIHVENGTIHRVAYRDLRQTQGFFAGEQLRFEWGADLPKAVILSDILFLNDLRRLAGERGGHFHRPIRRIRQPGMTALAGAGAVGLVALFYFWAIPALVSALVPHVPPAWEKHLGDGILDNLSVFGSVCEASPGSADTDQILASLTKPLGKTPYSFRIVILDSPVVNALAVPGGTIVLFRGLVENTESPEELAGVLAHEVQHVLLRHSTQAVLRRASTGILLAAVSGDVSAAARFGLEGARTLGLLEHSRRAESAADEEGIRLMSLAGIDPAGMIRFFESIDAMEGKIPEGLKYLSSHPGTPDRIKHLRRTIDQIPPAASIPLLPGRDWTKTREVCPESSPAPIP